MFDSMFGNDVPLSFVLGSTLGYLTLLGWIVLATVALVRLLGARLSCLETIAWVLLIYFVPALGVVAFLIVKPDQKAGRQLEQQGPYT